MLSSPSKTNTTRNSSNIYNYTKIIDLDKNSSVNFYGRVVNIKPARQTRGADWVLNLVVVDDSLQGRSDFDSPHPAGLTVAIFKKSPEDFPAVKDIGDIVQFRHFKIQYFESNIQALSTNWSAFTVFQKSDSGSFNILPHRPIHHEELEVVERLSSMKIGSLSSIHTPNPTEQESQSVTKKTPSIRPTLSVSEVRPGVYFNGTFKVMKISGGDSDDQFSFLVADFTENPFLSADPEAIGFPAYLSQCLLPVTLWDNFAVEARRLNIKVGDFVYLDNLVGRSVNHGNGMTNVVAVLHGDPLTRCFDKFIRIQKENKKIDSQAVRLAQLKESLLSENQIIEAVKPKTEPVAIASEKKKSTKRTFAVSNVTVASTSTSVPFTIPHQDMKFETTSVSGDSLAITTILSVRSFHEDNSKFCVKARILSLSPSSFWEMVRFMCDYCHCTTDLMQFSQSNTCSRCKTICRKTPKFVWVFGIVIEDATGDLAIICADEDAESFLGFPAFNLLEFEEESWLKHIMAIFEQLLNSNQSEHLFCIKSYRVDNEDGTSSLRYRLFNTKMFA